MKSFFSFEKKLCGSFFGCLSETSFRLMIMNCEVSKLSRFLVWSHFFLQCSVPCQIPSNARLLCLCRYFRTLSNLGWLPLSRFESSFCYFSRINQFFINCFSKFFYFSSLTYLINYLSFLFLSIFCLIVFSYIIV